MRKLKLLFIVLVCITCPVFALNGCGEVAPPVETPVSNYSITFTTEDDAKGIVLAKDSQGNSVSSGDEFESGSKVTLTAAANEGYSFDGWYVVNTKVSSNATYEVTLMGDLTFQARFTINEYLLNYSSNDTSKGMVVSQTTNNSNVEYNKSVTLTATPVTGYTLDGWYVGNEKVSSELTYTFTMPASEYAVQAKFSILSFVFGFSAENGKGTAVCSQQISETVEFGTAITLTAAANEGYSFEGWYAENQKVSTSAEYSFNMPANDYVLLAKFTKNSYQLNFSTENQNKGTVSSETVNGSQVEYGASVTLTATPVTGYTLDGWYVGNEKVSSELTYTFTMPASEYAVQAKFSILSFVFGFSAENGKGTAVCSQQISETVEFGTAITLTATANKGYSFEGWYAENQKVSTSAEYSFNMPANDYVLLAKFTKNSYQLNFSTENQNKGTVSSETVNGSQVEYGASVTLTAISQDGYEFDGWYEGGNKVSASSDWTFNMPSNARIVEARFTAKSFTLIYAVNDEELGRIESKTSSNSQVAYNSEVTLIAVSLDDGYQFDGWFINDSPVSSDSEYTFIMPNGNLRIEARFSIGSFTLTYNVNDQTMGSVSCVKASGTEVEYGTTITLNATEKTGYEFCGWYVGDEKVSESAVYAFNMPANVFSTEARFKAKEFAFSYTSDQSMGTVSSETENDSSVAYGTSVIVTATEKTGYEFDGWYKSNELVSSAKTYTFNMPSSNLTLTAKFKKAKFTLGYSTADQLKGTVSSATANNTKVEYGASVTITATENTGYDFDGWYVGDDKVSESAVYTFTMPANEYSLTAKFKPEKRNVYFNDGNDRIHTEMVDYNTAVSAYAYNKANYKFEGWFTDVDCTVAYDFNSKVTEDFTLYAKTEKDVVYYDVQFVEDDGTTKIGGVQKIEEGKTVSDIPTVSKTGYTFSGWEYFDENENKYVEFNGSVKVTKDLTVKATYTPIQLKVKLYSENVKIEQNLINTLTVNYNEKTVKPQTPEKENYLFVKWVYFDNVSVEFDFNQKLTADVDLLAIWQEKPAETYTVKFYDEIGGTLLDTQTVQKNGSATAPSDPEKTGHTFTNWDKVFDNVTENLDIYAVFTINTYKVVFKDHDGTVLKEEQTVNYNEAAVAPDNPERTGYTFTNWDKSFDNVTEDLTVTATYQINKFTITFMANGSVYKTQIVEYGSVISVPETPSKAGFSFAGWYKDASLTEAYDFNSQIISNVTVYAKFEEIIFNEFNVEFKDHDGTVLSAQTVIEGQSAIAPGNPERTGYTFTNWDKSFDNVTENLTITAQYKINTYKVVFKDHDGTVLKEEQTVNYNEAAVAPDNPERTGYTFTNWDKSFDNVTEDLTVTATYQINKFTITFMANGSVYKTQIVEYGKTINLPDTPTKAGNVFRYWYLTDQEVQFDISTTITEDLTLYAYFEELVGTFTVEFKVPEGDNYVTYGNVQYVSEEYGLVIEPAPYEDQSGKTYVWCLSDGTWFDFNQKITNDLTLYAMEVQ